MLKGFYLLAIEQMRMQRRIAAGVAAFTLACTVFAYHIQSTVAAIPVSTPVSAAPPAYYVAYIDDDGYIAIAKNSGETIRTQISARSLPEADQIALEQGIALDDPAALAKLLEDYGS